MGVDPTSRRSSSGLRLAPTLVEALLNAPPDSPFATMWRDDEDVEDCTFGEFVERAAAQAMSFRERGVGPGDRVVIIMPQGIELMTVFAGAMLLGGVPSILAYPTFKIDPAKYRAGLAGVTANLDPRLVVLDDGFPDELLEHVQGDRARHILAVDPSHRADAADVVVKVEGGNLAFIQHSAGTTGLQKGVALTHAQVVRQLGHLCDALQATGEDRIYSWLPLYHDMGLVACFILPMAAHLPVVMQSPTDWVIQPGRMLDIITSHRSTLAWVPNFALQFIARRVRDGDLAGIDLSNLRALINCSEPITGQSMDEFLERFAGCGMRRDALATSYAMAENTFAVTQSRVGSGATPSRTVVDAAAVRDRHEAVPAGPATQKTIEFVSSGRCLPACEVRVVSAIGEILGERAVGEILVRSDSLFDGYFNRPDLDDLVFVDGWYRTGDLGFIVDGEIFAVGRSKDLIIQGGKNIYPQDVEDIAFAHPAIRDGRAVAFGLFNADLGTEDIVVVAEFETDERELKPKDIERAIKAAVVAELGVTVRGVHLKPPMWIVKSTAGKPARSATKMKLLAEHPELATGEPSIEMG